MTQIVKTSSTARFDFVVFDQFDVAVTGLVNGDFTKFLTKNGVVNATTVTVTEVASGVYTATFIPDAISYWSLNIRNATYNLRGWFEDYTVITGDLNNIDAAISSRAIAGDAMALTSGERTTLVAAVFASVIETGYTFLQTMRIIASILAGKISGGPGTPVFRNLQDSADRVSSVADSSGNRTSVTLTP